MKPEDVKYGWCNNCGQTSWVPESGEYVCVRCGDELIPVERLSREQRRTFKFQVWNDQVGLKGLMGPSPGGAAADLGCHRTMIDKLADRGILERSVYNKDGFFVVYISDRSIMRAQENKKQTGKWTDSGEDV